MEKRVAKIEQDVAVLGTRVSHVEEQLGTIKDDLRVLSSKMDRATGMILAGMALLQVLGFLFAGS